MNRISSGGAAEVRVSGCPRRGHAILIIMVLIALAIGLFLYFGTMGGTSYTQQLSQTRKQGRAVAEEISTQQLSILIAQFRAEQNRLPKNAAELENDMAFRDPWGGTITFEFEEARGGQTTVIYRSNGPDGQRGTPDDVEKRDSLPY